MTDELHLAQVPIEPEIVLVRGKMTARFGTDIVNGRWTRDVWARHSHVLTATRNAGGSLLDIGCAQGIFPNAAAFTGTFGRIVGIDIRDYEHYVHLGGWVRRELDVTDLDYPARSFDVVTACEILEHLDDAKLPVAVRRIKRVAKRVVVTVPYRERRLPSYHVQRFDEARLLRFFPDAELRVLRKQRPRQTDWVLADWTAGG